MLFSNSNSNETNLSIKILNPIDDFILSNEYFQINPQTLIEQFKSYDKTSNDELLLNDNDFASGDYSMPNTDKITSINNVPLLTQTASNLFELYCPNSTTIFNIRNQSITCKFKPLIIRNDGLSLVDIEYIDTTQIICAPPIHEKEGATITSSKRHPILNKLPYNTINLFDFSQIEYYHKEHGNILFENHISQSRAFTYNKNDFLNSINPNNTYIIYVNGCEFC